MTTSESTAEIDRQIKVLGDQAVEASRALALLDTAHKNRILDGMADALAAARADIQAANQQDCALAQEKGITGALLDRLQLTESRIEAMIAGFQQVIQLDDPIGTVLSDQKRTNDLRIIKRRVPLGVIAVIYESRPNVTADVAALCLKSGNAVILRGGSEALQTNRAIATALLKGGMAAGMPRHALQLVSITDRDAVRALVQLEGIVDIVIPRGGESLIRAVTQWARVPIIKHDKGLCHVYIDEAADLEKALQITENAKCQRPGVCNAIETLLVHRAVAPLFLPRLEESIGQQVELRGDPESCQHLNTAKAAQPEDWDTEYLDLILSVKVVPNIETAITHINTHGSHHSDSIVSENQQAQAHFLNAVDSAVVYSNASTRFTDGFEFGMGAEIGISTDKLHARGPVGLNELTTYKYCIVGHGQIRQ